MKSIAAQCDEVRGAVIALAYALIGAKEPDKETQLAMERLVFEMDRVANRCEELHGPKD